ncbi:Pirin [hydrothermal vent metagenome]|uniref:Pirin n=1 Tax=hydrothermal vent metagenome TaxID=652676 RepID=A0A3B1C9Y1_9ZZZZ
MLIVRKSEVRGQADHGWLDTRHTFSFANYYDPEHMGFSALRVINDDRVAPGGGFPTHSHSDMEIISYVLDGALEHKDSMGNGSVINAGEFQVMSAGTGVTHSEYNPSSSEAMRFLQIWIIPDKSGVSPSYQQPEITPEFSKGKWCLIASGKPENGAAKIHQRADVYVCKIQNDDAVRHVFKPGRRGWLQVAKGRVQLNELALQEGDGVAISDEREIILISADEAEILLFDLP